MIAVQLQDIARALGLVLPPFYVQFMEVRQQVESELLNDTTLLYGTSDLLSRNEDYAFPQYLPGYLCIGNNSGDYGVVIRADGAVDTTIYQCPLGSLAVDDLAILAADLSGWRARGYDADEVIRESSSVLAFQSSELFQLRGQYVQLKLAVRAVEEQRKGGHLDLKAYILAKRSAAQALADFLQAHPEVK